MGLCFPDQFLKAQKPLVLVCFVTQQKHLCGIKIFSKDIQQVGGGTVLFLRLTSWPVHGKRKMGSQLFKKMTVVIPMVITVKPGEDLSATNVPSFSMTPENIPQPKDRPRSQPLMRKKVML